ncbi:hypothetical protein [Capnocytophaga canimorsus]|uniref:hypothetical protein n=1 Tax=Capnocytophaga canimorsus TaxID=28188 RepID=UPI0012FF77E9|nr:hypothetical protein [Capnocytophaga canimorsus]
MCYVSFDFAQPDKTDFAQPDKTDFAQPDKTNFAQLDILSINLSNKLKLHIYP